MKLPLLFVAGVLLGGSTALYAQETANPQPPGVADTLQQIATEPSTHSAVTFDRDMLQAAGGMFGGGDPGPIAGLNSITVENYRYRERAFYVPEEMHALVKAYAAAGWTHLVDQNVGPKLSTTPEKPLTDLWLHFKGTDIDGVTVLVRAPRQMSLIEVSGILKPLDLVHLSGHFGIPKVDPGAVMVPAPPGK